MAKGIRELTQEQKEKILSTAESVFGIPREDITSTSRVQIFNFARHCIGNTILIMMPEISLKEVGRCLNRDHASVVHWRRNHENYKMYDDYMMMFVTYFNALADEVGFVASFPNEEMVDKINDTIEYLETVRRDIKEKAKEEREKYEKIMESNKQLTY